jgi:hypothetical protein
MAGVVRARRQLVDQQLAARRQEKFDAQDADDIELFERGARNGYSFPRDFGRQVGGGD